MRLLLGSTPTPTSVRSRGDVPPFFTVSSYDAVQEVLRDGDAFSSTGTPR